jgi:hypothetical protein
LSDARTPTDASVTDAKIATTLSASKVTGTAVTQADTGTVTNTMLAGSIADTKLNQITTASKVANSATTATNANTASAIVARDASGNFTAGTITAALTGNVTGNVTGNAGTVTNGVYTTTTSLPNVTSVNSTTIPASSTLVTTGTTSLPNVTSVNSTTIPASSTLLTTGTGAALGSANSFTTGTQTIATGSDSTVGLRLKRNSVTQSANIVEVTQSDGSTILAKIDASGNVSAGTITPTTQLAANTTSTTVPAVVVAPKGSFTLTGVSASHTGSLLYNTITVPSTVGFYVGQSVILAGLGTDFNTTPTTNIQSIVNLTTLRVDSALSGSYSASGGTITASGTQQNLQEWQRTDGTVLTAINPAGGIVTPLGTGVVHQTAGGAFTSSTIVDADINASAAIASTKLNTQRSPSSPTGFIEPIPRYYASSSTGARNNGYIPFTGFYADKTYNITAASTVLFAGAAAAATAGTGSGFISRVVLMSVSSGTYSVIARTGNISAYYASGATTTTNLATPGLLSAGAVVYTGTFDATATLTEGQYYMIGVLQYASSLGTATFASLGSSNMNNSGYSAAGLPGLLMGQYQPGTAADVTTSTTFTSPSVTLFGLWTRITV